VRKKLFVIILSIIAMFFCNIEGFAVETENKTLNVISNNERLNSGWYADNGYTLTYSNSGAEYSWFTTGLASPQATSISDEQDAFDTTIVKSGTTTASRPDMQDGGIAAGGSHEANTNYVSGNPKVGIIWDLKDVYSVERMDIICKNGSQSYYLGKALIYGRASETDEWVSIGGVSGSTNMNKSLWDTTVTDAANKRDIYQFDLTKGLYRYVKVEFTAASQAYFSEMYIFGEKVEYQTLNVISNNEHLNSGWYADNGYTLTYSNSGAEYSWFTTGLASPQATSISDEQDAFDTTIVKSGTTTASRPDMQDGGVAAGGSYEANTNYVSGNPKVGIIWDLKDLYLVERMDIICKNGGASDYYLGKAFIYGKASETDEWTDIGSVTASTDMNKSLWDTTVTDNASKRDLYQFNLTKGQYRYIKVEFTAVHQAYFSEMYIFGEEIGYPVSFNKTSYLIKNENSETIDSLSGADSVVASGSITNNTVVDRPFTVISAIYESNVKRLLGVGITNGIVPKDGTASWSNTITDLGGLEANSVLYNFVWNNTNELIPLAEPQIMDKTQVALISGNVVGADVLSHPVCVGYELITTGNQATAESMIGNETALFDGDTQTNVVVDGENNDYVNIIVNLNTIMKLSEIDVYALCSSDSYMSEYDVYSSIDGINYEYIATKENITTKTLNRTLPINLTIDDTIYSKYIKLVIKKEDGVDDVALSEIKVYGKYPAFASERITNYCYEEEVPFKTPEEVINEDSLTNLLSDGIINTGINTTGDYVSIIYSWNEYRQVEDIVVYGEHSGCELLTSLDGVSYTTVGFYPETNGTTSLAGKSYSNAKFAKLVFRKGELNKITLNEIEFNTRKLYDSDSIVSNTPEKVSVKTHLKPNNILYLDWSGYNHIKNDVTSYKVYIEENNFSSTKNKTEKAVYCDGNSVNITSVDGQSCLYAGLEPDKDYFVAVLPVTENQTDGTVTPVKIHTYSALGGETLEGIFCINEYPYGGGAHVEHEDENANLATKLKLINDMEVLSKTRYWYNDTDMFRKYISNGLSFHQYVKENNTDLVNSYGIYSFASINEPDLHDTYKDNPAGYVEKVISSKNEIKGVNEKNILCEASVCGTDKLNWVEALYQADSNYGSYYDVFDIHAYCKGFEGSSNMDDNITSTSESNGVPEHLFGKVEKIRNLLDKYDDNKDIIFTEIGWSTHELPYFMESVNEKVTREEQANYVARAYLVSAALGVKNVFLYAFQDEGTSTTNKEEQFGIVDWYGTPKPAYYTYYTIGKLFRNAEFVEMKENISHPNYVMTFYDDEKDMYMTALWNISGNGDTVTIDTADAKLLKIDAYGNSEYINDGDIEIQSAPIYIYSSDILNVSVK